MARPLALWRARVGAETEARLAYYISDEELAGGSAIRDVLRECSQEESTEEAMEEALWEACWPLGTEQSEKHGDMPHVLPGMYTLKCSDSNDGDVSKKRISV